MGLCHHNSSFTSIVNLVDGFRQLGESPEVVRFKGAAEEETLLLNYTALEGTIFKNFVNYQDLLSITIFLRTEVFLCVDPC